MLSLIIYLVGLVFSAGVAWARSGAVKKDVNGLGSRVKTMERESNDRFRRVCMALLILAENDEEKKQLIDTLGAVE